MAAQWSWSWAYTIIGHRERVREEDGGEGLGFRVLGIE